MSPRPRFDSLDETKRGRILDAAEEEFGEHGFAQASLNRIIRAAGISKGAVYYYFDDKRDLFSTLLERRLREHLSVPFEWNSLTAETFWPAIERWFRDAIVAGLQRPTMMRLFRTVLRVAGEHSHDPLLAPIHAAAHQIMAAMVRRGQGLGLVRDDMPTELLVRIVTAAGGAIDVWLLERSDDWSATDIDGLVDTYLDTLRRLLAPARDTEIR